MPEITVLSITDDLDKALDYAHTSCPSLALLVIEDFRAEELKKVQTLKAICPQVRIITTKNLDDVQSFDQSAIDVALAEGIRPEKLAEIIAELLRSPGNAESRV
jgi:hypothetical protein